MGNKIIIQHSNVDNTKELSVLAKDIYQQHYLHLWHNGGANWYMNEYAYHPEKLKQELEDPNNLYFIAYENGKALGYLKLNIKAALQGFEDFEAMEIERIYLYKEAMGKGIGKQLMQFAFTIAQQKSKHLVFLKAMDSSLDAIAFYKKMGFEQCGIFKLPMPTFTLMKEQYRGMVILKKDLKDV